MGSVSSAMSSVCAPASSSGLRGSISSTCSTPSVARMAIRLPSSFLVPMRLEYPLVAAMLHLSGHRVGHGAPALALGQVEREVDARGHAAGGQQVAVVDHAR